MASPRVAEATIVYMSAFSGTHTTIYTAYCIISRRLRLLLLAFVFDLVGVEAVADGEVAGLGGEQDVGVGSIGVANLFHR